MPRGVQITPPAAGIRRAVRRLRHGTGDPTTRIGADECWRATLTPHGPATVHVCWDPLGVVATSSWGPGAAWLDAQVPAMCGEHDEPVAVVAHHPAVQAAQRNHPYLRVGASGTLYHDLLPTVLAQRITGGEAADQWRRLVYRFGEPAPGPHPGLRLPPAPEVLADLPSWTLHRLGIERRRADTLRAVARCAERLWDWSLLDPASCAFELVGLSGVGQWTIGCVLASALGDPDAVAVGDFHLKNMVAFALVGEPRGTDERMLELLAPYAGQRGRVVALLAADGWKAPAFGPRRRILPMSAW